MKNDVILKVENISKQYRLGIVGTGTISHDLNRWWYRIRGKEDPFLKIGEANDRSSKGESDYVWALKDINFEVKKGEILGIIGKNGAGKSTLLKILSKVTGPTTGGIKSKGRIASLLEVGTGFHPEMTGKENVFLNGAILGMTKKEIAKKLDEIVVFSGCERYIDTPVKRYSSGMKVRLAFAVAAFLEPDILVIDEVLAVGDAEFQKKAIGKIQDISSSGGRTVLFVSHNMAAVQSLCTRGLVLNNGKIQFVGGVVESVNEYLKQFSQDLREVKYDIINAPGNSLAKFIYARVSSKGRKKEETIREGDALEMEFEFYINSNENQQLGITFHLYDEMGTFVFVGSSCSEEREINKGYYREKVIIPTDLMQEGIYTITKLLLVLNKGSVVCEINNPLQFEIMSKPHNGFGWKGKKEGTIKPKLTWELI